MQSLNERLRRFVWGLGAICGLNILLALILFLRGNAVLGMYAATFLVFLIPVTVGFLFFKQALENILDQLERSKEPTSNPSYQEQPQLSISAD
jgi:hypothetical protein